MGAPGIALLGPLLICGDSAALSPRDRVVLTALAIHPAEAVSPERLADALWGERPPASWHKVVPGCILRLRRTLGADAIETTPYGYRIAVSADQIDVQRFERLQRRGRELLAVGEPERAQHTLAEALELWRGQPLMDLEGWEPARIEAQRLIELRMETEEYLLDASLRSGRHAEVLAQAQSAAAAAPLRERRWALVAIAQYQSGRQADALQTLHRARALLLTELGLDPGPDLVALEGAILRQDPALAVPSAEPDEDAACPYQGLLCYDIGDAETFFGRDAEVDECLRRLETAGILAVVGPSGCGKSSLVRAGVAAALLRAGRLPFVVTAGSRPTIVLTDTPSADSVLMVDQFEEVFTLCTDPLERKQFFAGLAAEASRCPVTICMRADHLSALAEHPEMARLVEGGLYLLGPMDEAGIRSAITGPAASVGLLVEPGLVDLLVRDVEGQPGALPLLSHALRRTWERREGRVLTIAGYQATGGIRGSVAQSAEQLYESLTTRQRALLRQVLLRLVSAANDGDPVRTRVLRRLLLTDPEREHVVERLVAARLVTADGETVQIAHESLARAWPRLANWLEEDIEGQRILRHLSASADAWDGMGRPDTELYRGTRLDQALEWQHADQPDLTANETAFIDAGVEVRAAERRAAEQHARQLVRTRRRTRILVAGVVALLATALLAGLLAVRQQHEREAADLAAAVAEARRVDDASRNSPDVDHAMLLALEAQRLHDSPETRAVVADLLSGHRALIRSLVVPDPVQALAVSPDGRALLVGEGDAGTTSYRTDPLEPTSSFPAVPGWTIAYRADGAQLLLAGRGAGGLGESADELSAAVTDPALSALRYLRSRPVQGTWVYANDAAYSADGRSLVVYAQGGGAHGLVVDSAVVVWRDADLERPVLTLDSIPSFAVALSPDGRLLYVGTREPEPALTAIDIATGLTVNSVPLAGAIAFLPAPPNEDDIWHAMSDALEVSPDGKTVAVAEGNDVVLYDSATLSERDRLRGHNALVRSLQFSREGALLASGSADHTAVVWDVATSAAVHRLAAHSDSVLGLAFSPDDSTLYTAGLDRHLLVWDLTGRRQFVTRIVDGPSHLGRALPAPDGRTVLYAGSRATDKDLQFLDVATGQRHPSAVERDGDPLAAWLPPANQYVVTVAGRDLRVWDRRTRQLVVDRTVVGSVITALAADPGGEFVVVGARDGSVVRVAAGALTSAGPRIPLGNAVVAIAPGPGSVATALLADQTYAIVNLADGGVLYRGAALGMTPTAAVLSQDGHRLAVGGSSGEVGLLDLDTHEWIAAPVLAHRQFVDAVSFGGDGATLVTASFDGAVRIWDGNSGVSIAGVQVGEQESPAVATMLPGERIAIVATDDGAVYRLDTRFDQWIAFACAVAGRNLTDQEWHATFGDQPHRDTCSIG